MANVAGGQITWVIDADKSAFERQITAAGTQAQAFGRSLKGIDFSDFASQASNAFGGIANGIENAARKIGLLTIGGGALGSVFLKSAADLQTTSKSFQVLIGDADRANQLFAQIKRFADQTPFQFPELADSARVLLGFGVGVEDVFGRLKTLGDISAVTGADLKSLSVVFGQVTGAGRLMGQDALQLVNNNIPITTILTKKLGISAAELRKRIEAGAISSELFAEALTDLTKEGGLAFRGTDELAKTFNGRLSTLKDTALEAGRNLLGVKVDPELGLVVKPGGLFDRLSLLVPRITESLKTLGPRLEKAFDFIMRNGDTVKAVIVGIGVAFVAAKLAAIGFAIAAAANPFTLIAAAIVAFIGLLTFLQVKFDIFGKLFAFLKPVIDPIVSLFKELFKILGEQLAPVIDFVSAHLEIFKKIGLALLGIVLAPLIIVIGTVVAGFALLVGAIDLVLFVGNKLFEFGKILLDIFGKILSGIVNVSVGIFKFYKDLPGRILEAIGNVGGVLFNVGKDLIQGFINGIKDKFNDVKHILGDLTSKLTSWKGPASLDKKILNTSGRLVIQGFISGLESQFGAVQSSLGSLTNNLDTSLPSLTPNILSDSPSSTLTGNKLEQNNTFNVYNQVDLTQGLRDLAWQLGN